MADVDPVFVVPVTINPTDSIQIQLGDVPPAGRVEKSLRLENQSGEHVTVVRIDTDCECVTFSGALDRLKPNQKKDVSLVLDMAHEPEFQGLLGVPASGIDDSGRAVFKVVLFARIGPP